MGSLIKRDFFKKNGKILKNNQSSIVYKEKVSSLYETNQTNDPHKTNKALKYLNHIPNSNSKIVFTAVSLALFIVLMSPLYTSVVKHKRTLSGDNKYSIYSSKPLTLEKSTQDVGYKDSRAQKINEIFKAYSCPLEGLGDVFVSEADKNDIPWWLAASVAFQESSCGKNTPKVSGEESYNAWGWGVYGDTTHTFENWVRGIETVSSYFSQKFFSKGINDLCEIMKIYTPSSDGSWCSGVNEFAEQIRSYQTP
jgi:hypothetical protein